MQQLYLIIGSILACHVSYLFIRRRIRVRSLPPKFWTWDPIMNFDWIIPTVMDARKQLTYLEKYGDTYRLPKLTNPMTTIVTRNPENVHAINTGKEWGIEFRKPGMGEMLGMGFLCADDAEWMRSRKMLRPAFNRPNIDNFEVLEGVADGLVRKIEEADGKVEMGALLYDALMHSSMHFILGIDSTKKNDGRPMDAQTFNKLWQEGVLGMGIRLLFGSFIDFAIERQEKHLPSDRKTSPMAEIVTPQAKDRADARAQLMQTMLASQDTTGVLTCNAIQLLSSRPDIWAQLRAEVSAAGAELFTWERLRANPTIQNILSETLRLRPVFPQFGRLALRDTVLPSGGGPSHDQPFPIPKGTFAITSTWGIHLSKEIYGPDADEWKPERWDSVKPSSKEFAAFGQGPRACLGKDKALAEAAYLLMRLVKRFEGVGDVTREWKPDSTFSMKNSKGYKVAFKI